VQADSTVMAAFMVAAERTAADTAKLKPFDEQVPSEEPLKIV
jgi:hypothetical protein